MITSKRANNLQNKMNQLDKLIETYNDNLNASNAKAALDGNLEGVIESVDGASASSYDHFTMFIDRWGTSTRKVGR